MTIEDLPMRVEGSATAGYVYLWRFTVPPGRAAQFERAYGPDGPWVRLFRQSPEYLGTELLRDRAAPDCYVTIDRWRSEAAWRAFRAARAAEFEAIDAQCEQWTREEVELGRFEPVPDPGGCHEVG